MLNALRTFGRARVAPKSQNAVGKIFLKSMQEELDVDNANEILLAAYILKLHNYHQIEDEFCKKFPLKFKSKDDDLTRNS